MALKVFINQSKTKQNLKLCNIYFFFFFLFFFSIGIYRAGLLHLLIILSLSGPRGNMGPFLLLGTSKIEDLFRLSDMTVITPETAWHKQHYLSISSLFQHHLEEQWKTWGYEHIDQGTFWTLYHLSTHLWGHKIQTGCMMFLVDYSDSQRGQVPAHKPMQESYLCMKFFCIYLSVFLLPQQTVQKEIGHILHYKQDSSSWR